MTLTITAGQIWTRNADGQQVEVVEVEYTGWYRVLAKATRCRVWIGEFAMNYTLQVGES